MSEEKIRCKWCTSDQIYIDYHDSEWGVESHDDQHLFEMICLEGAQAGLSWITILKKRPNYRKLFLEFDAEKISQFPDDKLAELAQEPGIIRHKGKIKAFVENAKAYLKLKETMSFSEYLWEFVGGSPIKGTGAATSKESTEMSKALKALGFKFVGPTICHAFMQAVGMVQDHDSSCWRYKDFEE